LLTTLCWELVYRSSVEDLVSDLVLGAGRDRDSRRHHDRVAFQHQHQYLTS
jgi:hypothetical protein